MNDTRNSSPTNDSRLGWKMIILICSFIIITGGAILTWIFTSEPEASRSEGSRKTAMLVEVQKPDTGSYRPYIEATGQVKPSREIILRPRVEGEVLNRNQEFTPGGFVEKGDTLLQINPADYKNKLQKRKSSLADAQAELKIEQGNQDVAQYEYESIGDQIKGEDKSLVLREPQLKIAQSNVQSAKVEVEQARLDLERTQIEAPFDAHILERNVDVGSQVSPGDNLARLVGYETYWIETNIPLAKIRWLSIPDTSGERGARAKIKNTTAWSDGVYRTGHLHKLIGELDDQARMARVLIRVRDPLNQLDSSPDSPALMAGSFVETTIRGKKLQNVIKLKREFVRDDQTVWIMEDEKLDIRQVTIRFQDDKYAYISDGITAQDKIVTTNLSTVVDGASLRTESSPADTNSRSDTNSSTRKKTSSSKAMTQTPTEERSI